MWLLVFPQLGEYISDIASNMMLVEEHILWMAQNEARACTRIVQCVERIADLTLTEDHPVISKVCYTLFRLDKGYIFFLNVSQLYFCLKIMN